MITKSAIDMTKNPIFHSRTKYINIKYHFCCAKHTDKIMTFHGYKQEKQTEQLIFKTEKKIIQTPGLTWFDPN